MASHLFSYRSPHALAVTLALGVGLAGCGGRAAPAGQPSPPATPSVASTLAMRGTIVPTRNLGGFIAPAQNVLISSSLTEPAQSVNVGEGQHVRKGDVLASFNVDDLTAEYQADLHAALAADANAAKQIYAGAQTIGSGASALTTAAATLAQANQKLQLDQLNLTRDTQLVSQGYISQQTQDTQAQTVASDRAAVAAAQAGVASARLIAGTNGTQSSGLQGASLAVLRQQAAQAHATAQQVAAQIARATLYAPVDGVVTNRNLNPGEFPASRTLFTIQALSTVYAQLNASSEQIAGVRVGNTVAIGQHGGQATQTGKVVAILGQAAPGSTNFTIKVALANSAGGFLAGMAVDGRVTLAPVAGTQVPRGAFVGDGETMLGVVRNGTYHVAPVAVIAETTTTAIVTGIEPGTRIVADGSSFADGQKVALR